MNATKTPLGSSGLGEYAQEYRELIATNYFGLASFVVLLYDHALTFDDEVRYIWRGKKKLVAWLFFINRYVTPLGFAVNINAYTSRAWTPLMSVKEIVRNLQNVCQPGCFFSCQHFVRYEGAMTLIGISIASLMMGVRVTAIYHGNRVVLALISLLFLVMIGVNAWLLTWGEPVHHPVGIHGCSMIYSSKIGGWAPGAAWLPLLYDTAVVVLVVLRTRDIARVRLGGQSHVVTTLIKDGLLYYSVILAANLVLAIMIVKSSEGIKNICAQFQLLITVTMMSRITLNLRKNMQHVETTSTSPTTCPALPLSYRGSLYLQSPRSSTPTTPRSTFKSVRTQNEDLEAGVLAISGTSSQEASRIRNDSSDIMTEWREAPKM